MDFLASYDELLAQGYGSYLQQLTDQGYDVADAVLQTQFYRATQQVHTLSETIAAAQAAGQTAAIPALKTQLQYWLQQMGAQSEQAHTAEAPGPVLTALDAFSDEATKAAKAVGVTALNLVSALPYILWGLVILAGLYVFFVYLKPRPARATA